MSLLKHQAKPSGTVLAPPHKAPLRLTNQSSARYSKQRRRGHMEEEMTDTVTVGQELQGQILETVSKSQEMAIEAIKTWTDALQPMTSAMPPVTLPLAGKLPKPCLLYTSPSPRD